MECRKKQRDYVKKEEMVKDNEDKKDIWIRKKERKKERKKFFLSEILVKKMTSVIVSLDNSSSKLLKSSIKICLKYPYIYLQKVKEKEILIRLKRITNHFWTN